MSEYTWSPIQAKALDDVGEWYADPHAEQVFRLFGYAGTGKTTLAMHLAEHARAPIFAAYTGKAASVLREKGCPGARTLHSLLYNVTERDRTLLRELQQKVAAAPTDPELLAELRIEEDKCRRPWFYVNEQSDLRHADLLVVDEVSMVDERIGKDILSFGKKVLVLGDPAQLPPVRGGGYFTNQKPDVLLTEIHRQAADNPILVYATMARRGEVIPFGNLGAAQKFSRKEVDDRFLAREAGQLLAGKNETRRDLNERVRGQLGRNSVLPVYKDTLVMLMNDHRLGVLNGTICHAQAPAVPDDDPRFCWMNIKYEGRILFDQLCERFNFDPVVTRTAPELKHNGKGVLQLDYGYCLTVHKAQGSQWDTVTLYDDGFGKREPETRRRWLYTAITRAAKQLYIITS